MTTAAQASRSASALGEYLWARRSLVQPESVGLVRAGNRRVPGLRREEVARLASISPEYYLRLEQGNDREPSDQVLRGIARALQLDDSAEMHLRRLRHLAAGLRPLRVDSEPSVPEDLGLLFDRWTDIPAFLMTENLSVLGANSAAASLGDGRLRNGFNLVESAFAGESGVGSSSFDETTAEIAAALRYHGNPYDRRFQRLVGALSIRSARFRLLWARHDARPLQTGRIPFGDSSSASFMCFEPSGHDGILLAVIEQE